MTTPRGHVTFQNFLNPISARPIWATTTPESIKLLSVLVWAWSVSPIKSYMYAIWLYIGLWQGIFRVQQWGLGPCQGPNICMGVYGGSKRFVSVSSFTWWKNWREKIFAATVTTVTATNFRKKKFEKFFFDFFKLFLNFIGLSNDNLRCAKFSNFYPFRF